MDIRSSIRVARHKHLWPLSAHILTNIFLVLLLVNQASQVGSAPPSEEARLLEGLQHFGALLEDKSIEWESPFADIRRLYIDQWKMFFYSELGLYSFVEMAAWTHMRLQACKLASQANVVHDILYKCRLMAAVSRAPLYNGALERIADPGLISRYRMSAEMRPSKDFAYKDLDKDYDKDFKARLRLDCVTLEEFHREVTAMTAPMDETTPVQRLRVATSLTVGYLLNNYIARMFEVYLMTIDKPDPLYTAFLAATLFMSKNLKDSTKLSDYFGTFTTYSLNTGSEMQMVAKNLRKLQAQGQLPELKLPTYLMPVDYLRVLEPGIVHPAVPDMDKLASRCQGVNSPHEQYCVPFPKLAKALLADYRAFEASWTPSKGVKPTNLAEFYALIQRRGLWYMARAYYLNHAKQLDQLWIPSNSSAGIVSRIASSIGSFFWNNKYAMVGALVATLLFPSPNPPWPPIPWPSPNGTLETTTQASGTGGIIGLLLGCIVGILLLVVGIGGLVWWYRVGRKSSRSDGARTVATGADPEKAANGNAADGGGNGKDKPKEASTKSTKSTKSRTTRSKSASGPGTGDSSSNGNPKTTSST